MKNFFNELFEFSRYMNHSLITAMVEQQDMVSDKSLEWMNHILNAHQIWNSRITQDQKPFGVWDLHAIEELVGINAQNFETTIKIIGQFEFETVISYTTSRGDTFKNSVRDILFHIINHSTYHRGQIAADFRQTGLKPLMTDYIFYRRGK